MKPLLSKIFLMSFFFQAVYSINSVVDIKVTHSIEESSIRAVRPDVQDLKDFDAVVGPDKQDNTPISVCCDRLLRRIGTVHEGPCSNSVLGIFGDACEILGPDATISGTLFDLCQKFFFFNEIFTVIDGIEQRLCDKFEGVFTVLETLLIESEEEFNNVFTALDEICNKLENIVSSLVEKELNAVFTEINDLEETLCDKFEGIFTVLDDIVDTKQDGFNATFTILDRLCEKIESITGTLLLRLDVTGIFTAINELEEGLCDKFEGVFTTLEIQGLCDPVPLTQDDVVGGVIILDIEGINYCMAENITGDIEITSNNINLDMNNRVLFGVITIDADEVTVENGKLRPPAPLDTVSANIAAITINSENIVLRDLLIVCDDTLVPNLNGRPGISNLGNKTLIIDCVVQSGSAFGSNIGTPANGGFGIFNAGDSVRIINTQVETGLGGSELLGGSSGSGGIGITGAQEGIVVLADCLVKTGVGGDALSSVGGRGGDGLFFFNGLYEIVSCKVITGDGGQGLGRGGAGDGLNALGLVQDCIIEKCVIKTGLGNFEVTVGGVGIQYRGNALLKVKDTCIITGPGSPNSPIGIFAFSSFCNELENVTVKTGDADFGGDSGIGVTVNGPVVFSQCQVMVGNGGENIGNAGLSGNGIEISSASSVSIGNCNIAIGGGGNSIAAVGGNSGNGIIAGTGVEKLVIEGTRINIGPFGTGPGGNGSQGNGIDLSNVSEISVINSVVENALIGYNIVNSAICINNSKALQCSGIGFSMEDSVGTLEGSIRNSTAINCVGDGFFVNTDVTNFQLLSNKSLSNGGIGFNNTSLTPATISVYNNVASMNVGGNFSGVTNVEAIPADDTGFYANIIA